MTSRNINGAGVPTARGRCPCTCKDITWPGNSCEQEPCCSECDPMPCAFEVLLPCPSYYFDNGEFWIAAETITLRQDCVSPLEECIFYAVGPGNYYGSPYHLWTNVNTPPRDEESDFCSGSYLNGWFAGYNQWGMDWCRPDASTCVPCTWSLRGVGPGADTSFPPYWVKFDLTTRTLSQADGFSPSTPFPTYTLREGATWSCTGCNELVTTDAESAKAWGLPTQLAIRAKDVPAAHFCAQTGDQADPDCGYDTKENLCECCDECCDELPDQPLWLKCGGCTESATVTPTIGGGNGLDGVDSPSGPTYGACATLCGYEVCGNWYCSGGQWKLDGYVDGDFCGTGDLTHTCCPLTLGTTTLPGCVPSGCDICVGPDCDTACCDTEPVTLTVELTSDCPELDGQVVTVTGGAGTHNWGGDVYFGLYGVTVGCVDGVWTFGVGYSGCSLSSEATSASCDPILLEFPAGFFVATPGLSCTPCAEGAWVSAIVTE